MNKSFLFFTPYASRTGSEMFLKYMLEHYNRLLFKAALVSEVNGDLLPALPPDIKTFITLKYPDRFTRVRQMVMRKFNLDLYEEHVKKINNICSPDYWYLNTILMANKVPLAKKLKVPVILHFHELAGDYALVTKQQLKEAIEYASVCVAASRKVFDNLSMLGAKKIVLQYECIDQAIINPEAGKRQQLRESLGLSRFNFTWLMSGTSIYRKGIDMVPAIAKHLKEQGAAIVWLGNSSKSGTDLMIEKEIMAHNLDNVFFLGKKTADYYDYMDVADGFVLTSREDTFPLVALEALALGKPIVSFNSGGAAEMISAGLGKVVNSWNVSDLADAMKYVSLNFSQFDKDQLKKRASDFDVTVQVKNWENMLSSL